MPAYVALLSKVPESDYGVYFPDFPGCVTAGKSPEEAYRLANEALRFHIEGMLADGDPIPSPSQIEQIMRDPDHAGTVAFLVDVPATRAKAVRVNLTFDESLLEEIDARAQSIGKTRSGFLADAARQALKRHLA